MHDLFARAELRYVGGELFEPLEMPIRNGRVDAPGRWEDCGFELRHHESAVKDYDDPDEIAAIHYPEISEFARELTGCDAALVGGHIRRNPEQAKVHQQLSPITAVHSDFAASYEKIVFDRYRSPAAETQAAMDRAGVDATQVSNAKRMVILQFWRNTGAAKMDFPLAFCDARTVGEDELVAFDVTDYAGSGANFQALGVRRPADPDRHKWYAYPEMERDEVVVFRTFDTARVGGQEPFWTPHCAFHDPDVPEGQPARRSIELRATCLFL